MSRIIAPLVQLRCTMGHIFTLVIERKEDITTSMVADSFEDSGYAIYRDRTVIACPHCGNPCRRTGVNSTIEVNFTPSKEGAYQ